MWDLCVHENEVVYFTTHMPMELRYTTLLLLLNQSSFKEGDTFGIWFTSMEIKIIKNGSVFYSFPKEIQGTVSPFVI